MTGGRSGVLLVRLYNHSHCLFFIRVSTCGYKSRYNHLFLLINYIDISLLGMKFDSGLSSERLFLPDLQRNAFVMPSNFDVNQS